MQTILKGTLIMILGIALNAAPSTMWIPESTEYKETGQKHIYKKTEHGDMALYVDYPQGWKKSDKRPVMVFFFGGGWTSGSVRHFHLQAKYFAARGMVTVRPDYRVKSRQGVTPHQCVEDAKSAVRWVRKNAGMLGIDPDNIVASGGSAGGHLAACTYIIKGYEASGEDTAISSRPNLLVLFNPALDLRDTAITSRVGPIKNPEVISPLLGLSKDTPPVIIFFGTKDFMYHQGPAFAAKAKEMGVHAELYTYEGQEHGFFNHSPWFQETLYKVDTFLGKFGYIKGKPLIKVQTK
jgi:acetyl esterase/lipase